MYNKVILTHTHRHTYGFSDGSVIKNPPDNSGDTGNAGSVSGWGRSLGVGNGNPLQYSYLENPVDRKA